MALAYTPPGVNVEELFSPSVSPLLSASAQICLVGLAQGYEVTSLQANFLGDDANVDLTAPEGTIFQKVDSTHTFESVRNLVDPTAGSVANQGGYAETTDFVATLSADKKTVTVNPVLASDLADVGGLIAFTVRVVPDKYYEATRLDTQAAIEARYGPAFDDGGIVTPLSAAASFAFENGARSVVIQPLFKRTTAIDPDSVRLQPTLVEASTAATIWQQSLYALRGVEDVNLIVPVVGQSDNSMTDDKQRDVFYQVQDHIQFMASQGQLLIQLGGEDSAADATRATAATLRTHAGLLRARYDGAMAEQTVIISPSRFKRNLPNSSGDYLLGGQYVAAALAGMIAARPISTPLTRKRVSGFLEVSDPRDKGAKDADAEAGLLVVEQKGTIVQVRHSITLDNTSVARRELSVVRAKHHMIESVRQTLDTQVIGEVPADGNAPFVVKNAVIGVLESLRQRRELVDYTGVQARTLTGDPTTVECRFSYLPAFPLNYVNIVFSLDLTGGTGVTTTFGAGTA